MKKKPFVIPFFLTLSLFIVFSLTADAVQSYLTIDTEKKCSLSLTYHLKDEYFEGMEIQIFYAAYVSPDVKFKLSESFDRYPINIDAITSQTEWDSVASTLNSYIIADNIIPAQEKITDKKGTVKFDELTAGLYLVRWTKNQTKDTISGFEPFMICVPNLDDNNEWDYDIDCYPKPGEPEKPTNEEIEYKVVVLWDDLGFEDQRPDSVQVEVFKDGVSVGIYTITADDNWSFIWTTIDDGSVWTVAEYVTGLKYDVTVTRFGNVFTIVNYYRDSHKPNNPDDTVSYYTNNNSQSNRTDNNTITKPLKTGRRSNEIFYLIFMCGLSVILTVLSVLWGRRNKDEE